MFSQVVVSLLVAVVTALGGYAAATALPAAFGFSSVNAAGSMTVVAGLLVVTATFFALAWDRDAALAPFSLARSTAIEDLLAALWRQREQGVMVAEANLLGTRAMFNVSRASAQAKRRGLITIDDHGGLADQNRP